jgi:heat shock protein HslJ
MLAASLTAFAQETDTNPTLEDTLWRLGSYVNADGTTVDALPSTYVTAEFDAGTVTGNGGCNRYFGSYTADGSTIEFSEVGSTLMACAPDILTQQEAAYLAALRSAAAFTIENDKLQMMNAGGDVALTFTVLEPTPLVDTTWVMTAYNNGEGGLVSALADTQVTAIFDDEGQVGGHGGCNTYGGSYSVDDNSISFSELVQTLMMCAEPEGVSEQETGYLAALGAATTYSIRGDRLELRNGDDQIMVSYVAQPEISGIEWQWQSTLAADGTMTDVPNPENYTLSFNDDGSFAIVADCNQGSGTYALNGDQISIEVGPLTRVACPPESLSQDYLDHLAEVSTVSLVGENLILSWGTEGAVLVFAAS